MKRPVSYWIAATIADRIRDARDRLRLTQAQVADRIGVERPIYARMERGVYTPTLRTVYDVAEALEVSPLELLQDLDRIPSRLLKL